MKKILFILAICAANYSFAQDLVILHTNDLHSQLNGLAPEAEYTPLVADDDPTLGGMARFGGYIKSEKERYGDKLLVVDDGDFSMGTLFQTLEPNPGFQLKLMKRMGIEFTTLGNHEFDFGPEVLASIIKNNKQTGEIPQILNSNYIISKDGSDKELAQLFHDKTILPFKVINKNGYKIGLFGLLGKDAHDAMGGDCHVKFENIIRAAKRTVRILKDEEKVDLVIALSHSGVSKQKDGSWKGEDYKLLESVPNIDIVISGHTHTELNQMVTVGNGIIVQTGCRGEKVGNIEVKFDKNKKPTFKYRLIPMDDTVPGDPDIQKLIDEKSNYIDRVLLSGLGINSEQPLFETTFDLIMDIKKPEGSNIGPIVSDAVYYMLNNEYHQKVDMTIVASGVIRHDINKGKFGKQNINDLFNVMPLGKSDESIPGSPLGKIYITGNELKKVMELIFAVYHSKEDYYLYSTGMHIKYNPEKGLFRKISEIKIGTDQTGYRKISFSKKDKTLYCLAANKYILSFIGTIRKMSFGLVNIVAKNSDGLKIQNNNFLIDTDPTKEGIQEAKEWLALLDYVKSFPDKNGNGIPDMPDVYKSRKVDFQVVK